jgi:hypothetical protein
MSVQTLKRTSAFAGLLLFAASSLLAGGPSARTGARSVFLEDSSTILMFGGVASPDIATGRSYELDETWQWDGTRWIRRYPAHSPSARFSYMFTYDSEREQAVLFGGRNNTTELTDTWLFKNGDWTEAHPATSPSKRTLAGFAYDRTRGVTVMYGGQVVSDDGKAINSLYDMWEFDGANWTKVLDKGPEINKPVLVFDEARNQLLMLAVNAESKTLMYGYDVAARTWNEIKPEKLPTCVNEAAAVFVNATQQIFVVGGACPIEGVTATEEAYTWDGTNWTVVTTETLISRSVNRAVAYDAARDVLVMFGGTLAFTTIPLSTTNAFSGGNWSFPEDVSSPGARSLFGMSSDPATGVIYMLGGISDQDFFADFWKFENGLWNPLTVEGTPGCASPLTAFDTNRSRLVAICTDSTTFEFDGTAWTALKDLKTVPNARKFASMVYDETLKKTVLYGGYDEFNGNYVGRTWTWDGTTWVEQAKKNRPYLRALTSMWYDPVTKKTLLYGGVGRKNSDGRLERFNDMWSFDGTKWTQLKPSAVPPIRYGAQLAVNPTTNRTILFGGLRLETDDKGLQKQVYANDTWEWDGTTWRQLSTDGTPTPRENGAMAWDYAANRMILFGGWSGFYNADTWELIGSKSWRVFAE